MICGTTIDFIASVSGGYKIYGTSVPVSEDQLSPLVSREYFAPSLYREALRTVLFLS